MTAESSSPARYGYSTLARAALAILALDQASKELVRRFLPLEGQSWPVGDSGIGRFFHLLHAHNTGVAFGLAQGRNSLFLVMALGITALLLLYARGLPPWDRWTRVALGCQVGGALGNAVDRLRLGHVTDFLDVHYGNWHWPTFNVADSAINVGVGILLWQLFRAEPQLAPPDPASPKAAL